MMTLPLAIALVLSGLAALFAFLAFFVPRRTSETQGMAHLGEVVRDGTERSLRMSGEQAARLREAREAALAALRQTNQDLSAQVSAVGERLGADLQSIAARTAATGDALVQLGAREDERVKLFSVAMAEIGARQRHDFDGLLATLELRLEAIRAAQAGGGAPGEAAPEASGAARSAESEARLAEWLQRIAGGVGEVQAQVAGVGDETRLLATLQSAVQLERRELDALHAKMQSLEESNQERQRDLERVWQEREAALRGREDELLRLRQQAQESPARLQQAAQAAAEAARHETEERAQRDLALVRREADELKQANAGQAERIAALERSLAEVEQQLQDIALRAIGGPLGAKALAQITQAASEHRGGHQG